MGAKDEKAGKKPAKGKGKEKKWYITTTELSYYKH